MVSVLLFPMRIAQEHFLIFRERICCTLYSVLTVLMGERVVGV